MYGQDHDSAASLGGSEVRRWRRRLADERAEASVYRALAGRRSGEERQILLELAEAEQRHAAHWEQMLGNRRGPTRPSLPVTRLPVFLARRFGWIFVLALVQRAESRSPYDADTDATPAMAADERVHAEVVRALAARGRAQVSGRLRAAVFGVNDGLVSNLALVVGVTAGGAGSTTVLLTGLTGLLSGALSMGTGEYISVRSQRELLGASAPDPAVRGALPHLDLDANELALVYRAQGMTPQEAQHRAEAQLHGDHAPDPGSSESTEEERREVVGSGLGAAVSSFGFFAAGATVPVLPFLLRLTGTSALAAAVALVGLALMLTGATVGILSGAPPLRRALRQLAIGATAAAATYLLGLLFGTLTG